MCHAQSGLSPYVTHTIFVQNSINVQSHKLTSHLKKHRRFDTMTNDFTRINDNNAQASTRFMTVPSHSNAKAQTAPKIRRTKKPSTSMKIVKNSSIAALETSAMPLEIPSRIGMQRPFPTENSTKNVKSGKAEAVVSVVETTVSAIAIAPTTRAKRSRVPKDFAEKYSTPQKERKVIAPFPVVAKKARKTADERAKIRQLMMPDDDLIQRLARSQTLSTKVKVAPQRHTKNWESRCGKCGTTTTFSTPAALCGKCGAITVRVLD